MHPRRPGRLGIDHQNHGLAVMAGADLPRRLRIRREVDELPLHRQQPQLLDTRQEMAGGSVVDDARDRVAIQGADPVAPDRKALLIAVGEDCCNAIPGQCQVVDPVEGGNEVGEVRVAVNAVLVRVVTESVGHLLADVF